jgi:hypothetical protein
MRIFAAPSLVLFLAGSIVGALRSGAEDLRLREVGLLDERGEVRHGDGQDTEVTKRQDPTSPPGCTGQSFLLRALTVSKSTFFNGNALNSQTSNISFSLANKATGTKVACAAESIALTGSAVGADPYAWYECGSDASNPTTKSKFQFDSMIMQLTVNQTWACADKDPAHPTAFEAFGLAGITYDCIDMENDQFGRKCQQSKDEEVDVSIAAWSL